MPALDMIYEENAVCYRNKPESTAHFDNQRHVTAGEIYFERWVGNKGNCAGRLFVTRNLATALIAFAVSRDPKKRPNNTSSADEVIKKVIRHLRDNYGHSNDESFQKAILDLIAKHGTDLDAGRIVHRVFRFQEAAKAAEPASH